MHGYHTCGHYMHVPHVVIPRVGHGKLHETCVFHAMRKHGPQKHVTGLFKILSCRHACQNEVIIERYHMVNFVTIDTKKESL